MFSVRGSCTKTDKKNISFIQNTSVHIRICDCCLLCWSKGHVLTVKNTGSRLGKRLLLKVTPYNSQNPFLTDGLEYRRDWFPWKEFPTCTWYVRIVLISDTLTSNWTPDSYWNRTANNNTLLFVHSCLSFDFNKNCSLPFRFTVYCYLPFDFNKRLGHTFPTLLSRSIHRVRFIVVPPSSLLLLRNSTFLLQCVDLQSTVLKFTVIDKFWDPDFWSGDTQNQHDWER